MKDNNVFSNKSRALPVILFYPSKIAYNNLLFSKRFFGSFEFWYCSNILILMPKFKIIMLDVKTDSSGLLRKSIEA